MSAARVVLLSGGLGGARLAPALARRLGDDRLTVVANVGDDLEWMGLAIAPDADSILYALAGVWDGEQGWGRSGESFAVRDELAARGEATWFGVGDRDLAFHLWRTAELGRGRSPTEILAAAAARFGVRGVRLLPASDEPSATRIVTEEGSLSFQEWYVREHAEPPVVAVELAGGRPSEAVLAALGEADLVILGPSNPVTSIGAILALDGVRARVAAAPRRLAVCPVVRGAPSADPAIDHHARARARVLAASGRSDRAAAIAGLYVGLADAFLVDPVDAEEVAAIRALGMEAVVTPLLDPASLADAIAARAA